MADFRVADPAASGSQWALGQYFAEIGAEFGFETGTALDDAVTAFAAQGGRALRVARLRAGARYNGNADADVWFSKPLARGS